MNVKIVKEIPIGQDAVLKVLGANHGALLMIKVGEALRVGPGSDVLVSLLRDDVRTLRDTLTAILGESP